MPSTILINQCRYVYWLRDGDKKLEYHVGKRLKHNIEYGSVQINEIILPSNLVNKKVRLRVEVIKED